MSDAVHLALLIGGFTLIAISIIAGAVLLSQWIRHQSLLEKARAEIEPTTKAGIGSCIGSGMSIVGNIECDGPAQVFGRIEGELRASDLLIGDGAQVEGNVLAKDVTVCGRVKGTIRAAHVKLQDGGAVNGDIFHQSLSIAENALFEGSSRRIEDSTDAASIVDAKARQKEEMQSPTPTHVSAENSDSNVLSMQIADESVRNDAPDLLDREPPRRVPSGRKP
jgi:cytoskeletal protein CcmA (bactofilin family)